MALKVLNGGVPAAGYLKTFSPHELWLLLFDWLPTATLSETTEFD